MTKPGTQDPAVVRLDVTSVAPKDRFDTIMGAYDALAVADALELTVDHDPTCMYYTLRATRGEDTFRFEYLERGPVVWRVRVDKQRPPAVLPEPHTS